GQPFTAVVATFTGGGALSATIDWGDSTTSSGVVVSLGNGQFAVVGSHTYAEDGENEMELVDVLPITVKIFRIGGTTVTVIGGGTTVNVTDTANVTEEEEILSAQGGLTFNVLEFQTLSNVVVAVLTPGPNESASEFTATIDWGDGTTSTGTVVDQGDGT